MCDCFHLAFPNWHGPATGAGRRLRGPEQDTEDDLACEEPEILERERPRPQGSSPVEEFPAENQAEDDFNSSPLKSGNKKSRRVGFGSLFDKRSSAKMSETEAMQSGGAGVIVKTVKDTCAEGLVVTGGGKEGIFIKEVKPDSPASRHMTMKEGDQILSATVYFDNVSYEDALQILEHAQPYKMELCVRRKVESTLPEDAEIVQPEGNVGDTPKMRSPRKKKQRDRISWPKFPSFGKGHRAQFKRSHSTSEAEEHKKLEMSPQTSDTESPFRSPLKSPDGKDKKRKEKAKLNKKMKGHSNKSIEESQRDEKELTSENLIVLEDQQFEDALQENFPETLVTKLVTHEAEFEDHALPSLSEKDLQHKVHLISLSNTLKTTDISDALADGSAGETRTSEEGKIERSEMKVSIHQKEKSDIETESHSKTVFGMSRTSDSSAYDSMMVSPVLISQAEQEKPQLDMEINTEVISKESSEKNLVSGNMEISMQKLDVSVDLSDVAVLKQSPKISGEKQWKERTVLENESYGIRTRGPLGDIATSKTPFASTVNGLQFTPPDSSGMTKESSLPETITIISQPKPNDLSAVYTVNAMDSHLETSKQLTETNVDNILASLDKKFKLPNVDCSLLHEPIKKTHLPKREDIEIPGMEDKEAKLQTPGVKIPKIEKIINITKDRDIQAQQADKEFNVEDVKEAVFKFPALKLPEGDITGVLVQREITIMEMKADKTNTTPRGSPRKISETSADGSTKIIESKIGKAESSASNIAAKNTVIKIPKVELPYAGEETIAMTTIDYTKPKGEVQQADEVLITDSRDTGNVKFKLPKREDIEIPGMEAIDQSIVQNIDMKVLKDNNKKFDKPKGREKKSKKHQISMPSFGITKPDIRFPDIGIELPKKDVVSKDSREIEETKLEVDADIKLKYASVGGQKPTENTGVTVDDETETFNIRFPKAVASPSKQCAADISVVDIKNEDIKTEGQGKKFKLPKFEFSFPEIPKISASAHKKEVDDTRTEKKGEVSPMHLPEMSLQTEIKSLEFKLPGMKGLKIDGNEPKVEAEICLPEEKKETELKIGASFTLPEDELSKAETKDTEPDIPFIDLPLPVSKSESGQKEEKFGSPTKFKLPSINLPKFRGKSSKAIESINVDTGESTGVDISVMDIQVKEGKTHLPDTAEPPSKHKKRLSNTELKETAEPLSATIKGPDIDKTSVDLSVDMKLQDIENERQASKFKLPKFGIKLPEIKAPQIDLSAAKAELEISLPDRKVQAPDPEVPEGLTNVKEDLPEIDSKGLDVKTKRPSFSFPKFGFSKSDMKGPGADVSVPDVDVSLPEGSVKLEAPNADITVSTDETGKKDETKFGSPTKFKLPSITLPKFGVKVPKGKVDVSAVEVQAKGKEVNLSDAEIKLSTEPVSVDIKGPELEKEDKSLRVDIKAQDIQTEGQRSKLKFPKFGIGLPEMKGPKIDLSTPKTEIDVSLPEGKMEVHQTDVTVPGAIEVKAGVLEIDSKDLDVKTKQLSFTFPKFGFSKSEMTDPGADVNVPNVDVLLPEGSVELEAPNADVILSVDETGPKDETKFGSPTRFKLPSISLPTFGVKAPKGEADVSGVEVQAKGKEVSLPDAELKLSAETLSVDIKGPELEKEDKSLGVDIKTQDTQINGQGSELNIPRFGISLPGLKEPKVDSTASKTVIDVSLPEAVMEVHPPAVEEPKGAIKLKEDKPEIDSKSFAVKTKQPSFSFPKFGFSKSEMKAPQTDVSAPDVDVSIPEGSVELEAPNADVILSVDETEQKDETKFGSPTKFKLPSITLPTFGVKAPKGAADVSGVEIQAKGNEATLPDAELKLSAEPKSFDKKVPELEKEAESLRVDMKNQDFLTEEHRSKFKFPRFGISLPGVKGPILDPSAVKTEVNVSLPEGKMEVHPPDIGEPAAIEIKADVPETDSKDLQVKTKRPSLSFPKFGFSKSELKAPEVDISVPDVDVSVGSVELEAPSAEIATTKFKLPSITLPKFGGKDPKGAVDISDVETQSKGTEVSLPDAGLKLSAEPLSLEIKGPEVEIEDKSLKVDIKTEDIQTEEQAKKLKTPKFGISLPEVKGPKIDLAASKTETGVSHPPDAEVPKGAINLEANKPEIDSKSFDVKTKQPSFSFPKFGFSKSEMKAPEADVSATDVDVSIPEGSVELETPNADIILSVDETEQKDETKFGSPTKFKLPSITLPTFGLKAPKGTVDVSGVEVQAKGKEVSLPDAELKLSAEPLSADIKGPKVEKEDKSLRVDLKAQDIQTEEHRSKFKFPKFGISLPEVKGPKIDSSTAKTEIDVSVPEGKMEVHPPNVAVPGAIEVKADITEIDSKNLNVKTKRPSFSFPKFGFSKSEIKAPEADVSVPDVDVSLPEGSVKLEAPNADITVSTDETGKKDETKFGSPTKFKLPSITFPKFGVKAPKGEADVSDVEIQAKGKEVSLPDAELKLSAEPLSVKIKGPELEKEDKSLSVDIKTQDIQTEEQARKLKIPKFGISLPEVQGPKIDVAASKTVIDVSLPEAVMEVHPPDAEVPEGAINLEANKPEIDSKSFDVKTKQPSFSFPKFGFSKSEMKAPEADVSAPDVDVSIPEGSVELEAPNADITVSMDETRKKREAKFGSPTKFKLPSISLPTFGVKAPKGAADVSGVEIQTKGKEVIQPDAEIKLSTEPLSVDIKESGLQKEAESLRVDMKAKDIQTEEQRSKFKFPKFGISLPEVKGPKTDSSTTKTEIDISLPEGNMVVQPPDVGMPAAIEVKAQVPEIDSKDLDMKSKRPGFSFPKFGFSKSDMKAPDADESLPVGSVELEAPNAELTLSMDETTKKNETKFESPTKFKLPSITFPKFGVKAPKGSADVSGVEVQTKLKEVSLPDTEIQLSAEPLSVKIKGPELEKEDKSLSVDIKTQDIQTEEQARKLKIPKFGISLPEVQGPKIDVAASKTVIDVSLPEAVMEVHPPDAEVPEGAINLEANKPEIDSKSFDVKTKQPSFSFPKFGFSKSEMKAPEADVSAPDVDVSIPEGSVEVEAPSADITVSMDETRKKREAKFGSPTKFKLPSISLPTFGVKAPKGAADVSGVEIQAKGKEASLPDAKLKLSAEPVSVDIKGPELEKEDKSLSMDMKSHDSQTEDGSGKFKLPKFGISFPEVKGPKIDFSSAKTEIDISLQEGSVEMHPPDVGVPEEIEVKVNVPQSDSKNLDMKMKRSAPDVDVSLPEGSVELEAQSANITVSMDKTGKTNETKFGSPTKFKLPSITLPTFGLKAPKGAADVSGVEVQAKGKEVSLPDAELKLSAEPLSADIKGPKVEKEDKSLRVDLKAQDIQTEEHRSKFKFPKFGISLPEVKGPKIDSRAVKTETDISVPEGKMEVHPPDVGAPGAIEVKADLTEIDSKGLDVKTKRPSFSFPKFGFSKSEMKAPEADISAPDVDVSLPEGSVEVEAPNADITVSMDGTRKKDETKFGSPTKFKLPTITLPKFGIKAQKGAADISGVEVQAKGKDVSLPDAGLKLSAEPLSVDIKRPEVEKEDKSLKVDVTGQEIQTDKQRSKLKFPKFGISLPEMTGPKIDSSTARTEIDISLPEGKMEVHPPDTGVQGAIDVKADLPNIDSKDFEMTTKQPGFSFPKFGFSKSEMKAPQADDSVPDVDVSLPEGSLELEAPNVNVTVSMDETGKKDETKFGSPTKFKLPSITLPTFGVKAPKGAVDMSGVEVQAKEKEVSLPDAKLKLSAEPLSVDIKGPELEKEDTSLQMDMKAQDIQIKEKGTKVKFPKFGISLPEVKGPKIDSTVAKTEIDISVPEGKMEVHQPDIEVTKEAKRLKADMPEIDSEGLDVTTKQPDYSFPKFGFSKSEIKVPETVVNEGNADTALSMDKTEQKDETKFGSPTKFKLPSITFPKFEVKAPKGAADVSAIDVQTKGKELSQPDAELELSSKPPDLKVPSIDRQEKSLSVDMKPQEIQIEKEESKFKLPKFGIKIPEPKGTKTDSSTVKTKTDISLPEANMEVHPGDFEVDESVTKVKENLTEIDSKSIDVKTKQFSFSFPKFGFSKSDTKNVSLPEGSVDLEEQDKDTIVSTGQKDKTKFASPTKFKLPSVTLPKSSALEIKTPNFSLSKSNVQSGEVTTQSVDTESQETKHKENTAVTGSPVKFKLPTIKMPTFGNASQKTSETTAEKSAPEKDTNVEINVGAKPLKSHDVEVEVKDTIKQPPKAAIKKEEGDKGSSSRFKLPTIKMSKIGISKTKSQDRDSDISMGADVPVVVLESKHEDIQGHEKSSKFTMPALGDVLRGFDVEFNVPTLDEVEEAKTETSTPMKMEYETSLEYNEKQTVVQTDQKPDTEETQTQAEKSGWFRFPKFSSPTKTAKVIEKESSQPYEKTEENPVNDNKEKEPEQTSIRETEEDSISPTLSMRSSDAFADVSSALTTEQVGLSMASPTKVKVTFSESTATVEMSDLHGDVITSTAKTEVISMEPHQPEKVNIPGSSDMSSSSVDTQRQMSGEIHIVVSTVQTVPDTATINNVDTKDTQTLHLDGVAIKSDSVRSVEDTRVPKKEHTMVERHVVKEMFCDDKEKVFVTRRIQMFEGVSAEPISDDTASSIRKLRDTVHTEKMKFFEDEDSSNQTTIRNSTSLRHIDSSAEENGGK